MSKRVPQVEWIFLSQDEAVQDSDWATMGRGDNTGGAGRVLTAQRMVPILALVVMVATATMVYLYHEAQQGIAALAQDVQTAAEVDAWSQQHMLLQSAAPRLDDRISSPLFRWTVAEQEKQLNAAVPGAEPIVVVDPQTVQVQDDMAAAQVTLSFPNASNGLPTIFHQTRFYRSTTEGWLRTEPIPVLWGAPRQLETPHLLWQYRSRDQAAVAAAADQIDALYVQLRQDYGLPSSPSDEKLPIDVRIDGTPGFVLYHDPPYLPLILPSPEAYLAPDDLSEPEILAQAAGLALVRSVQTEASIVYGLDKEWPLLAGMALWHIWDMGLSLSPWKDELVAWVFNGDASGWRTNTPLPNGYRKFCLAHRLWITVPETFGIPLKCNKSDSVILVSMTLHKGIGRYTLAEPNMVQDENSYLNYHDRDIDIVRRGNIVSLATIVDYIIATYGRDKLPALVAAMSQHDSWDAIVPEVTGLTVVDFEQGWRNHVDKLVRCASNTACPEYQHGNAASACRSELELSQSAGFRLIQRSSSYH